MDKKTIKTDSVQIAVYASSALFIAAVVLHFLPVGLPYKLAFPITILAIASLWICPWQITCALALSAVGDLFGDCGIFIGQMAAFAVAHIFYISFFAKRYREKVEHDGKLTGKAAGYLFIIFLMGCVLSSFVFMKIIPSMPAGIIRTGASIYSLIICIMLMLALLQRSSLYALGAILFVFSDFILAWHMFVEPVEKAGYLIMIPYYIGQWLLFIRATPYRIDILRRHRM